MRGNLISYVPQISDCCEGFRVFKYQNFKKIVNSLQSRYRGKWGFEISTFLVENIESDNINLIIPYFGGVIANFVKEGIQILRSTMLRRLTGKGAKPRDTGSIVSF